MRKSKKRTVILILFVMALVLGLLIAMHFWRKSSSEEFPIGMPVMSVDDYEKELKKLPSDIEGMSKYDKKAMGLFIEDGSDSDFDGLTDKEEIEIYGSNPLKASTADDMYLDGYKALNDMDLFEYVEYEGDLIATGNECSEVILEIDDVSDLSAVVVDDTAVTSIDDFGIQTVYKSYEIYNYSGSVSLKLNEVNGLVQSNMAIYIADGPFVYKGLSELAEVNYSFLNEMAILDYEFDENQIYHIILADKKRAFVGLNLVGDAIDAEQPDYVDCLLYGSILASKLVDYNFTVLYTGSGDEADRKEFQSYFENYIHENYSGMEDFHIREVKSVSELELNTKYKELKNKISAFDYAMGSPGEVYMFLWLYCKMDDVPTNKDADKLQKGFDIFDDELLFPNFTSSIGQGGNCAGISHLTAYLYNRGELPKSGEFTYNFSGKDETVSWDISGEDNKTFRDRGLADYKDKNFADEHIETDTGYLGANLSADEEEFVKMVGAYWAEGNTRVSIDDYSHMVEWTDSTTAVVKKDDFALIEQMIEYLDQGKILDVYMYFRGGFGHAVNIYAYEKLDDRNYRFKVYDSNIPQDSRSGFTLRENSCQIAVSKIQRKDGTWAFDYIYWPLEGKENMDYMALSMEKFTDRNAFIAMDEEWNVFNDR